MVILEHISRAGDVGLTVSEIARTLDLPHNSTCRIVDTLHEHGYIERREEDRRYFLTRKLLDLARPRVGDKSLAASAFEPLCRLRDLVGETAQLIVRSQNKSVVIDQVPSRQPVKVLGEVGFRVPLYSCAPGKAILAALPQSELDEFFRTVKLKQFTPTTLSTREKLTRELETIRACGYSLDRSEGMEGIHCVGAAVLDQNGYPLCGITVIGPAFRLREEHFSTVGHHCIEIAAEIQRRVLA
ncbi:MAG TPA: IclR family transcriptional regulator [Planctomycetota bacterium]|nr:IclR family transcriptional regulator [Planctomycetota bacterium]